MERKRLVVRELKQSKGELILGIWESSYSSSENVTPSQRHFRRLVRMFLTWDRADKNQRTRSNLTITNKDFRAVFSRADTSIRNYPQHEQQYTF